MNTMKIAMAQIEVQAGHPRKNLEKILQWIDDAKKNFVDVIIFPEMAVSGYLLGDTWEQLSFLKDCADCGEEIRRASENIVVVFGNVALDFSKKNFDGHIRKYNACFVAQNGEWVQTTNGKNFLPKSLLPNYREFDDARYFFSLQDLAREENQSPEEFLAPFEISIRGEKILMGCVLCEDAWSEHYAFSPMELLKKHFPNINFFVNVSSSPFTKGKNFKRNQIFQTLAKKMQTPIFYVNLVGIQNNGKTIYTFDGDSTVYKTNGEIFCACPSFQEICQTIAFDEILLEKNIDAPKQICAEKNDIAEIYQALSFGIRKFLKQIHLSKVVIGVSGGIDSAVAAALYTSVLGSENILLVNMPSQFNSQTTKNLAKTLAKNLSCRYTIVPIQQSISHTKEQIETSPIENFFDGTKNFLHVSDFVFENIQARDRSSRILAGLAASFGAGFTCNANKTELTVGYSTLYGDNGGFLAALADLWKFEIYELAHYLNDVVFQKEVIPNETIAIQPSAELSINQNIDEGKGDPIIYAYHDFLFRSFVEPWDKTTPEEILTWYCDGTLEKNLGCPEKVSVKEIFPTAKNFIDDLERWWNLFTGMAIAKRIQSPPVLAVSRRAYGFDYREAQNGTYYTKRYEDLKKELLKNS